MGGGRHHRSGGNLYLERLSLGRMGERKGGKFTKKRSEPPTDELIFHLLRRLQHSCNGDEEVQTRPNNLQFRLGCLAKRGSSWASVAELTVG